MLAESRHQGPQHESRDSRSAPVMRQFRSQLSGEDFPAPLGGLALDQVQAMVHDAVRGTREAGLNHARFARGLEGTRELLRRSLVDFQALKSGSLDEVTREQRE